MGGFGVSLSCGTSQAAPAQAADGHLGELKLHYTEMGTCVAQYIYTLEKARKAHGDKVVLDNVTLSFLPGVKIGVVGPNGAGKSSLLKIMAGIEQVSNG